MLCYVLHGPGDLREEHRPVPEPGQGEALIKIAGCAICHTDLGIIDGHWPFLPPLPIVMGHEYAGTVVAVGQNATGVAPGDRVTVHTAVNCGHCSACQSGTPWLCSHRTARWGGYAEYVALPEHCLYQVPPEVTDDQAIAVDVFALAVRAVELADVKPGDSAVVIGGGGIGLVLVGLLRFMGAGTIVVSEPSGDKHALAREFGADAVLNPHECNLTAEVKALTGGNGAHAVFEVVGLPKTTEQALTLARRAGTIVIMGVANPEAVARIRPFDIFAKHLTIRGLFGSGWSYPRTIELLPRVRPERVLTPKMPLSELPRALEMRRKNMGIRPVMIP